VSTLTSSHSEVGAVLLQTTMAQYRDVFVQKLLETRPSLAIYAGEEYFDPTIRLSKSIAPVSRRLSNHFFFGRRALWQGGAWKACRNAQVAVLELNPRILSNWPIAVYRKLRRRRTLVWGHAWPRSGVGSRAVGARDLLAKLSHGAILYTNRDAADLKSRLGLPVYVAPNATVGDVALRVGRRPDLFIQVGRLIPEKRPLLTFDAFEKAIPYLPTYISLVYVGDGPEREALEARIASGKLSSRVSLVGSIDDRSRLADIYADGIASICAGYVGLAFTESLSFGVPVIYADDEPHSPEVALADSANSLSFHARNPDSLATAMREVIADASKWATRRRELSADTLAGYSADTMVRGFLQAVDNA
jgi:glycosyltransferase involved in cell wall biosynthesis